MFFTFGQVKGNAHYGRSRHRPTKVFEFEKLILRSLKVAINIPSILVRLEYHQSVMSFHGSTKGAVTCHFTTPASKLHSASSFSQSQCGKHWKSSRNRYCLSKILETADVSVTSASHEQTAALPVLDPQRVMGKCTGDVTPLVFRITSSIDDTPETSKQIWTAQHEAAVSAESRSDISGRLVPANAVAEGVAHAQKRRAARPQRSREKSATVGSSRQAVYEVSAPPTGICFKHQRCRETSRPVNPSHEHLPAY